MKFDITFELSNGDSGETAEYDLSASSEEQLPKITSTSSDDEIAQFIRDLCGNPEEDDSPRLGVAYGPICEQLCNHAFDDLGWSDVTAAVLKLKVDDENVEFTEEQIYPLLGEELKFQLVHDGRFMYLCS